MFTLIRNFYKKLSIVKKATMWFLICSILQKGIAFITTPIFTRLLTVEQYGQYSIYITWFQVLTLLTSFRLDYAVFNKGMSTFKDKDSYTSTMQVLTMVITIIFLNFYLIFSEFINSFTELSFTITILLFINVLFMNSISFWSIRMRYDYKYKAVVIVTLLLTLLTTAIGILMVCITKEKGIARIVSLAVVQILIGLVIFIKVFSDAKEKFNIKYAKFAIFFNIPLIPHFLSIYILEQSDKIMIQKMINIEAVGIYGVAYSIGNAINIIITSINQAIIPWIYRMLQEKRHKELVSNIIKIFMGTLIIISLFILIVPELLFALASADYSSAVYVIAPISASTFFILIYGLFATIEFYYNKNKASMFLSGGAAILNIVLNYVGIRAYGFVTAGYTTMICYCVLAICHLIYVNNIFKNNNISCRFNTYHMLLLIIATYGVVAISQLFNQLLLIRYGLISLTCCTCIIFRRKIIHIINEYIK